MQRVVNMHEACMRITNYFKKIEDCRENISTWSHKRLEICMLFLISLQCDTIWFDVVCHNSRTNKISDFLHPGIFCFALGCFNQTPRPKKYIKKITKERK